MKIGVLDIQGSVEEHLESLRKIGDTLKPVLVKTIEQLRHVSGLIIPGGESTTIGKLLRLFGLREEIIERAKSGELAVWGTCAGAILLAREIHGNHLADSLGLMDITVERNAYGRQLDSLETIIEFNVGISGAKNYKISRSSKERSAGKYSGCQMSGFKKIPAVFIRAPKIASVGEGVEILARYGGHINNEEGGVGEIVAVREKNLLATTFHPELTSSLEIHKYFVKMCSTLEPMKNSRS